MYRVHGKRLARVLEHSIRIFDSIQVTVCRPLKDKILVPTKLLLLDYSLSEVFAALRKTLDLKACILFFPDIHD